MRCAYYGLGKEATTNLSGDPALGVTYCQECAEYLRTRLNSAYPGTKKRPPPQTTHYDEEAT